MNRIDRLTAILTQLQSKRLLKAQEIADRFDISLRTVYRDMRALGEAGIPIIGEAGFGYSLVEGYRLPPVMFTKEEAMAFLMAEKILEKIMDKEGAAHLQSAMIKIKSVLRLDEKNLIENLNDQIAAFRPHNSEKDWGKKNRIQTILNALSEKKILNMTYISFDKEELTERKIEPIGVYFAFEQWYLIAWCKLRKAYRNFRVDRISDIHTLEETYSDRHPSLQAYLDQVKQEENLEKVVIKVPKSSYKYIKNQRYNQGFVLQEKYEEYYHMTFMSSHLEGFARWLLMMGDQWEVLEPVSLRERLQELLEIMLEKIKNPIPS
ncbi:helix-turn-helix transcriptional regulator [Pararhodonellum marinum]|uniref:helix-turn-helix transcriptional regulator n=1 Tax=Pararhodonellum marinum TaxID=2755358 RepID=UPI00188EA971|nr:YafY family protein [Pararhodonellum marinum]